MKSINEQSKNIINIVGKLLDAKIIDGKLKSDSRPYKSAKITIRTNQTYGGREETSDITVDMFATPITKKDKPSLAWDQIKALETAKTAQNVGIDKADTIRISRGNLRENSYVAKSGQLVNGWKISTPFLSSGSATDVASFDMDIFIMDMHEEIDKDGDATGRLVIKGAVVQYGGNLDVINFIVEQPSHVEYISRHWSVNDTVNVQGRIRIAVVEEKISGTEGTWGEGIPDTTPPVKRELIITSGSDDPFDEEFAYDPNEIKKAYKVRAAKIEQEQREKSDHKSTPPSSKVSINWEEI